MARMARFFAIGLAAVNGGQAEVIEHRGIWMHPEQFKTPELADQWVKKIAAARLNAIYPLVWYRGGTAWFTSAYSPMAADVPQGFDPLGHLISAAHARGIAVHAWFVNGSYGAAVNTGVFVQHPEWQFREGKSGRPSFDFGQRRAISSAT